MQPEIGHKTYILRILQVTRDGELAIGATLEDCQTNERRAFPSLTALLEFLEAGRQPAPPTTHDLQSEG